MHVAREHHEIDTLALNDPHQNLFLRHLVVGCDRQVIEGYVVIVDEFLGDAVIRHHADDFHGQ